MLNNYSLIKRLALTTLYICVAVFTFVKQRIVAEVCGKVDGGPVFLHIDVLESGKTVKKLNMAAIKLDSSVLVWKGLCIKPSFLYGCQGHAQVCSGGCGIGHYTPLTEKCSITPSFGVSFTELRTTISLPVLPEVKMRFREKFRSISPYMALDASYCFTPSWRIIGFFQYAWSRTHTTIKNLGSQKSHSDGPNYALAIEHDMNKYWSINLAAAYNISLTKEKHGLRGYGVRLGVAYWFY